LGGLLIKKRKGGSIKNVPFNYLGWKKKNLVVTAALVWKGGGKKKKRGDLGGHHEWLNWETRSHTPLKKGGGGGSRNLHFGGGGGDSTHRFSATARKRKKGGQCPNHGACLVKLEGRKCFYDKLGNARKKKKKKKKKVAMIQATVPTWGGKKGRQHPCLLEKGKGGGNTLPTFLSEHAN